MRVQKPSTHKRALLTWILIFAVAHLVSKTLFRFVFITFASHHGPWYGILDGMFFVSLPVILICIFSALIVSVLPSNFTIIGYSVVKKILFLGLLTLVSFNLYQNFEMYETFEKLPARDPRDR